MKSVIGLALVISVLIQHRRIVPTPAAGGLQWGSCIHWKIYKETSFQRVFTLAVDTLSKMKYRNLNDDSIHFFLKRTDKIEGVNPVWMGCYLGSCEDKNGNVHKVIFGQYGGILYLQESKSYYEVRADERTNWHAYLSSVHMTLNKE